jgi:hypothetical protein
MRIKPKTNSQYQYYNPNRYVNKTQPNQQAKTEQIQVNEQEQTQANKALLDLIRNTKHEAKPTVHSQPSNILDKLLAPKTPTQSPTKEEMTAKMLPPSWMPPPAPPSTPSTNLLDLFNAHNRYESDKNTNAYKKLLGLLNNECLKQPTTKNENIIKKLFGATETQPTKTSTAFPTMKPHEAPFQSVDEALSQVLASSKPSMSSSSSPTSTSTSASSSSSASPQRTIDTIFDKLKINRHAPPSAKSEPNENFTSLLSKISKPTDADNILKWFVQPTVSAKPLPDNIHVFTLKDIENRI